MKSDSEFEQLMQAIRNNETSQVNLGPHFDSEQQKQLCSVLSQNNSVTHLVWMGRGLGTKFFFENTLLQNQSITALFVEGGVFGSEDMRLLVAMLSQNRIVTLSLQVIIWGDTDVQRKTNFDCFLKVLQSPHCSITSLSLARNCLGYCGEGQWLTKVCLTKALGVNRSVTELDLSRNGLSETSFIMDDLVDLLRTNRVFRRLDLSGNNNLIFRIYLLMGVFRHPTLRSLNLNNTALNLLTPENHKVLDDRLELDQGFRVLERLDLQGNGLGGWGRNIQWLARRLARPSCSLTILDLSKNELWKLKDQIEALARGLRDNRSIRILKLNKNGLGYDEGPLQFLATAFCANDTLTTLEMMDNDLYYYSSTLEHLAAIFRLNRSLTEMNLGYNRIHYSSGQGFRNCFESFESFARAFKSFSEALGANSFITALNLSGHKLGWLQKGEGEVIQSLARTLVQNRTLVSLGLGKNYLGSLERKVMHGLVKGFCQNQGIRELVLKDNGLPTSLMIPFFRTTRRNKKLAYNAVRICTLIAFVRANRRNRLATSVLPLVPSVIELVGINNA